MLYTLHCKIDDLKIFEPQIAEQLIKARNKKGHAEIIVGPYTYMLSRSGRAYRVLTELKGEYTRGHWTEHPKLVAK